MQNGRVQVLLLQEDSEGVPLLRDSQNSSQLSFVSSPGAPPVRSPEEPEATSLTRTIRSKSTEDFFLWVVKQKWAGKKFKIGSLTEATTTWLLISVAK